MCQYVALTTDLWTSCQTQSYITITAHYISEQWSLESLVLQTRFFDVAHNADNLSAELEKVGIIYIFN